MRYRYWYLLGLLFLLGSCAENKEYNLGQNFVQSSTVITFTDTVTVNVSTVLLDSVPTSGQSIILVGKYKDGALGYVKASSYFEIGLPTINSVSTPQNYYYDSVALILYYTSYNYGDTNKSQTLSVYQLADNIVANPNGNLYNTSYVPSDATPLGMLPFKPHPIAKKKLSIRLSDALGREFLTNMVNQTNDVSSLTNFLAYFKGIFLSTSNTDNSSIIGYYVNDTTPSIRLYYHYNSYIELPELMNFSLTATNLQFNAISSDRTGTTLAPLNKKQQQISSRLTNDISYVQAGTGLVTRLDFPNIKNLLASSSIGSLSSSIGSLVNAKLVLQPISNTYQQITLPPVLYLCQTDFNNDIGPTILFPSQNNPQTGGLVTDNIYFTNTYYTYDITRFLVNAITAQNDLPVSLLLLPPSPTISNSLERLIMGDNVFNPNNNGNSNQLKLNIYFMKYE